MWQKKHSSYFIFVTNLFLISLVFVAANLLCNLICSYCCEFVAVQSTKKQQIHNNNILPSAALALQVPVITQRRPDLHNAHPMVCLYVALMIALWQQFGPQSSVHRRDNVAATPPPSTTCWPSVASTSGWRRGIIVSERDVRARYHLICHSMFNKCCWRRFIVQTAWGAKPKDSNCLVKFFWHCRIQAIKDNFLSFAQKYFSKEKILFLFVSSP